MTLTLDQEALMLRILDFEARNPIRPAHDAREPHQSYLLDAGEAGTREYVTVRALQSLKLVNRHLLSRRVRSTCEGTWLHDALNVRVRLRAAGLSTRSCPLRT
jgi:hypothetical protein